MTLSDFFQDESGLCTERASITYAAVALEGAREYRDTFRKCEEGPRKRLFFYTVVAFAAMC